MVTQPEALRLAAHAEANAHFGDMKAIAAELRRLHEVNQELVSALSEAVILVGDWGAYASEYFQNKHDLKGDIKRLNAAIAKATGENK